MIGEDEARGLCLDLGPRLGKWARVTATCQPICCPGIADTP